MSFLANLLATCFWTLAICFFIYWLYAGAPRDVTSSWESMFHGSHRLHLLLLFFARYDDTTVPSSAFCVQEAGAMLVPNIPAILLMSRHCFRACSATKPLVAQCQAVVIPIATDLSLPESCFVPRCFYNMFLMLLHNASASVFCYTQKKQQCLNVTLGMSHEEV